MRLILLICPCPRHQYTANTITRSVAVAGMVRQYRAPRARNWGLVTPAQQTLHDAFVAAKDACELQMLGKGAQELHVPAHMPVFDVQGDDLHLPGSRALHAPVVPHGVGEPRMQSRR